MAAGAADGVLAAADDPLEPLFASPDELDELDELESPFASLDEFAPLFATLARLSVR